MTLIEVAVALSIAVTGALGLNLAWSQSLLLEQQLQQARIARSEALTVLYQWQQAPQLEVPVPDHVEFYSQHLSGHSYGWQLAFNGLTGTVRWHGVWLVLPVIDVHNSPAPESCEP